MIYGLMETLSEVSISIVHPWTRERRRKKALLPNPPQADKSKVLEVEDIFTFGFRMDI